jgi:hypothetical protein
MIDFTRTESGLIVPVAKPEPKQDPEEARHGFPVKAGWTFSKCGERYRKSTNEVFRMKALEDLYTAVDPGGGHITRGKQVEVQERCERLLHELAVELIGGIPEDVEVYT